MLIVGQIGAYHHAAVLNGDSDPVVDPLQKFVFLTHKMQEIIIENNLHKFLQTNIKKKQAFPNAFDRLTNKEKNQAYTTLYDENLQLKNRIRELELGKTQLKKGRQTAVGESEMSKLQQKVVFMQSQLKVLKSKQSKVVRIPTKTITTGVGLQEQLQRQKTNVNDLLRIIDQLKIKLSKANQQIKKQQDLRQKQVLFKHQEPPLPIQTSVPNIKVLKTQENQQIELQGKTIRELKDQAANLRQIIQSMRINHQTQVQHLKIQLLTSRQNNHPRQRQSDDMQDRFLRQQMQSLKRDRDRLQDQLRRLSQSPFHNRFSKTINAQSQLLSINQTLLKVSSQKQQLLDQLTKVNTKNGLLVKQVQKLNQNSKSLKAQLKEMREAQIKKNEKTATVTNIYDFKPEHKNSQTSADYKWKHLHLIRPIQHLPLQKQVQVLLQEKCDLMNQLEKCQAVISGHSASLRQRQMAFKRRIDQLQCNLRTATRKADQLAAIVSLGQTQTQFHEVDGVTYDMNVAQFQGLKQQMRQVGGNWLDLWLGGLMFQQTSLQQSVRGSIRDVSRMMVFVTVDFFNHDTVHTQFFNGTNFKLNFKSAFKVKLDSLLVQYLVNDCLLLQFWGSQGTSAQLLGSAQISLGLLVQKSHPTVSPVLASVAPIYNSKQQNKLIGTVQFKVRLRYPSNQLMRLGMDKKLVVKQESSYRKVLRVQIKEGGQLPSSQLFAHMQLKSYDFCTEIKRGPNPLWNFSKKTQVLMSQQLIREIKTAYCQIIIFDNAMPDGEDIVGTARLDMGGLLEGRSLAGKVEVKDSKRVTCGWVQVNIAWQQ